MWAHFYDSYVSVWIYVAAGSLTLFKKGKVFAVDEVEEVALRSVQGHLCCSIMLMWGSCERWKVEVPAVLLTGKWREVKRG